MEYVSDVINTRGERFIAEYFSDDGECDVRSLGFYQLTYIYGKFALVLRPQIPPHAFIREKFGLLEGRGHAIMSIYVENKTRDPDSVYTFTKDCPGTWVPARVREPSIGRVREDYLFEVSNVLNAKVPKILKSSIGIDPRAEKFKAALLTAWEVRKSG